MSKKVFDLDLYLKSEGFTLLESHEGCGAIYKNSSIYIRVLLQRNMIQVGFEKTFDRWANSIDYEEYIPHTKAGIHRLLTTVKSLVKCTKCCDWGKTSEFTRRHNRYYCNDCYRQHFIKPKKKKKMRVF